MACGVCARSTRRAASLPGEGSTHLRGCGMTAVGTSRKCGGTVLTAAYRATADAGCVDVRRYGCFTGHNNN
jgi:hypothetical protein